MSKIAIVNRANLINYGSVLQCYALSRVVSELGFESELVWEKGNLLSNFDLRPRKLFSILLKLVFHPSLIGEIYSNYRHVKNKEFDKETLDMFAAFVGKNIKQNTQTHRELVKLAKSEEYQKFICGSDQVWASTVLYVDPLMYLKFAPKEKRVAYAPSIGRNYVPRYNRRAMKKYISDIPNISVREYDGQKVIKELTGRHAPVVLDPTLLLSAEQWRDLYDVDSVQSSGYMLTYFLNEPLPELKKVILKYAETNHLDIIQLGYGVKLPDSKISVNICSPCAGPKEFLEYVDKADGVITDSYHGMLFSLIFRKQFCSVKREYGKYDQSSRQKTVLHKLMLEEKYVENTDATDDRYISRALDTEIDYEAVCHILTEQIEESKAYLRNAL